MINEIYTLFRENLPDIVRSEETVKEILGDEDNYIFKHMDESKIVGVSVINGNTIYLLCVDKEYQNQGIGTGLLEKAESFILSGGFDKVVLGAGKDYIMPGVPMNNGVHEFFIKRGYIHSWGDCGCLDMDQMLEDYDYNDFSIGDTINEITYRWAAESDIKAVIECVSDAEENFVKYYLDKKLYVSGTDTPVLIAEKDGEVLGVVMTGIITGDDKTGTLNCAATSQKHRNKGIATTLVRLGTKHLKDMGLKKSFLSYTYTDIIGIYGKAGYKVCMEYFMGEKEL